MAADTLRRTRAQSNPIGSPEHAAERVFAILGDDAAGDLIEALLARMDAADGDGDLEEIDEREPDESDDDSSNDLEAIDERERDVVIHGGGSDGSRP
jgi:hypothetical protein